MPRFKNYIQWNSLKSGIHPNGNRVHGWLSKRFPYIVSIRSDLDRDLREIDSFTEHTWTVCYSIGDDCVYYYFIDKIDAVTVKLKFS